MQGDSPAGGIDPAHGEHRARNAPSGGDAAHALARALALARVGTWISDPEPDGSLYWPDETCRIFGVEPSAFDGRVATFFALVHPEDRAAVNEAAQKALSGPGHYEFDHRIVRADGEVRWIREWAEIERGPDGRAIRMLGVAQDITDRRALEEQFLHAQKMEGIGRLAGGIAHDFNNLLTVILGFSRLAADTLPADTPAKGWLGEVTEAAQRAATLTGQLLAFARRQIVAPRTVDLGATVRSATSMLGRLVGEDVRLDIPAPPDDLWPVRVDPGQFEQVLVNLVVNARDAMPDGGTTTVRVGNVVLDAAGAGRAGPDGREGEFVVLEVRDTGSGIPPEIRARIFEPFFTTKGPGKGTGLGLPTCYGIVRQAGGFIALDSAPGAGTSFRVFLPRAPGEVASAPRSLRRTVLLAEDAEPVRTFARCCLEADGHAVREAGDGAAALALIEAGEPVDILVADLVMPRMGGAELVRRALAARPGLRVLLVSGYTDDPAAREAVASSRLPFLAKPYSAGDLRRAVLETLEAPTRTGS